MLSHQHDQPTRPQRVVVLGGGGFIAGVILRRLQAEGIPVLGLGRPGLDLMVAGAADKLAQALDPRDTLVFASAKAPCKDLSMLRENLQMADAVCTALRKQPVAHLVYISSDAVYKDSAGPLTETSCAEPGALHGVMHLAREVALRQGHSGPLAIVRPTLVYGYDDPHNGYGPNRFRRLAAAGKEIVLFGEGEERRDHVFIGDVAEIIARIIRQRSIGALNVASGAVHSFRSIAEQVAALHDNTIRVTGTKRTGPMPHGGYRPFDVTAIGTAFPDLRMTQLPQGVERLHRDLDT